MKQASKNVIRKRKVGRPATGQDPVRAIRMDDSQAKAVESWARKQADKPSFSEAVRRLVAKALNWQA